MSVPDIYLQCPPVSIFSLGHSVTFRSQYASTNSHNKGDTKERKKYENKNK